MSKIPPAVLLARLENLITGARLAINADRIPVASERLKDAEALVEQIRDLL